ncbi:MAG: hypothetical protein WBO48_24435 [Candidatus Promineifilaceae bacterium]|nr:hypothetical protein [Chloroflexota bacterium]MBK7916708.1 hypothetical protein [Chloroflexota bacterium]MBK8934914.1 hypothetical protein [Chloroflexota bacterium]
MKSRKVLLYLMVIAALLTIFSSSYVDARSYSTGSNMLSSGAYVLTLQPARAENSAGYQLLDTPAATDSDAGCCCKNCLPIVQK